MVVCLGGMWDGVGVAEGLVHVCVCMGGGGVQLKFCIARGYIYTSVGFQAAHFNIL